MDIREHAESMLTALRDRAPLVQCITNTVVQQFTANALLAAGASPAMMDHEADAADFAQIADSLVVNFGTPTSHSYLSADAAIDTFNGLDKPWVVDPVGLGLSAHRTFRIRKAIQSGPAAVRGNASEIIAAAGQAGSARGTDSAHSVDAALDAAADLARTGTIAAVSGPTDAIVFADDDAVHTITVAGGSPLMPYVIGTGCSLGALTAAYLSTADGLAGSSEAAGIAELSTPVRRGIAAATAHMHFTAAAAKAHGSASGPGTFAPAFLDALYSVEPESLADLEAEWTTGGTA